MCYIIILWYAYALLILLHLCCISFIQDGGCVCPGDVSKAFGAGADFVMLGGMFAGHDESGGDIVEENGTKFKVCVKGPL